MDGDRDYSNWYAHQGLFFFPNGIGKLSVISVDSVYAVGHPQLFIVSWLKPQKNMYDLHVSCKRKNIFT